MLTVYIDFKCPASYLAFRPTCALADELGVEVSWKPYQIKPYELAAEKPVETKGETHRRVRAEQRRATHQLYAGRQGITLNFRDPSAKTQTSLAALTCHLKDPRAYIEAAFKAYWQDTTDLNDRQCVEHLLSGSGNASAITDLARAAAAYSSVQADMEETGIFTTPTYLVDEQVFVGREHLPWIGNLLTQKV